MPTELSLERPPSAKRRWSDSIKAAIARVLALAGSRGSLRDPSFIAIAICLLALWLAAVVFITTRHEFWRDEVRALSLARAAGSPLDLFGLIRQDGHPVLWYLLLYIGKSLVDTPLVLPVTSIVIAFAGVAVFMLLSPFPLWWKGVFMFSCLPFYEYAVMARNYGISMLLLFIAAALFPHRDKHSLLLAAVVALLANTNAHSAILASLIAVLWCWDTVITQRQRSLLAFGRRLGLPLLIMIAGVLLSLAVTAPGKDTILTDVYALKLNTVANAGTDAVVHPEKTFAAILPGKSYEALLRVTLPPLAGLGIIYLAIFGLLGRPELAVIAFVGQAALGAMFRVVYRGQYRHQGLFLIFLVFLYWVALESMGRGAVQKKRRWLLNVGFYGAMTLLVLANLNLTPKTVWEDVRLDLSSNKAFGQFLNTSQAYQDAIIVPEPDYLMESLPYYASNPIYIPREHRFGTTVSWTTAAASQLSLDELRAIAHDVKVQSGRPVLIVLGHREVGQMRSGRLRFSYNKTFSWTADELTRFRQSTTLVAEYKAAVGDENYRVYAVQ